MQANRKGVEVMVRPYLAVLAADADAAERNRVLVHDLNLLE